MAGLAYRIGALRWAVLVIAIAPVAAFAVGVSLFGVGSSWAWMAVAGLAWVLTASMTVVGAPAFVIVLLPFAVAASGFAFAVPWLDAGGSIIGAAPRWASLTIASAVPAAVAAAVGFIRIKGPFDLSASIAVAAPVDRVFDEMRGEASLGSPENGVTVSRDGEMLTVDYGGGVEMTVIERIERRNGLIVMEATSEEIPNMRSVALYTIRTDGADGALLDVVERVWNIPVGIYAAYMLSGILADYARSHRDRIEGRPPVSVRDLMTRQNHAPED